jgi:transcriptional regulator with XRE-family HTH domain
MSIPPEKQKTIYSRMLHQPSVSEAVRQLRSTLGLTQQAFAVEMGTALTTIARWETVRSPRGRTLNLLAQRAEKTERPDLAATFRRELMAELGFALRSQFRYAVRHQRQAASGAEALQSVVQELRRLSEVFKQPNVNLDQAIRAGKEIQRLVGDLEVLMTAAAPTETESKQAGSSRSDESEK